MNLSPVSINENTSECFKCHNKNADLFLSLSNKQLFAYAQNLYNLPRDHSTVFMCRPCMKELLDRYNVNAEETLSWDRIIASQSSSLSSSLSSQLPFIRPGPKSYKRQRADELGLPNTLEGSTTPDYDSLNIDQLTEYFLQQPALQPLKKKFRRPHQNPISRSIPINTNSSTHSSWSKSISSSNISVLNASAKTIPEPLPQTPSNSSSETAVSPVQGLEVINENDVEDLYIANEDDIPLAAINTGNDYISMGAPRRIQSTNQDDHIMLIKRVTGG